ncbi:MAG: hypothetical protein ABSA93_13065 [Streptosporangiaceae bacterium]
MMSALTGCRAASSATGVASPVSLASAKAKAVATHAPVPVRTTVHKPPATPSPSPSPVAATTAPATTAPAATAAAAGQNCTPISDEGTCYEPGEYCRDDDHGVTGVAGDGETITCEDNDGWRWEPS